MRKIELNNLILNASSPAMLELWRIANTPQSYSSSTFEDEFETKDMAQTRMRDIYECPQEEFGRIRAKSINMEVESYLAENPLCPRFESGIFGEYLTYQEIVFQINGDPRSIPPKSQNDHLSYLAMVRISGRNNDLMIEDVLQGDQSVDLESWQDAVMHAVVKFAKDNTFNSVKIRESYESLCFYRNHKTITEVQYKPLSDGTYAIYLRDTDGEFLMPECNIEPVRLPLFVGSKLAKRIINGDSTEAVSAIPKFSVINGLSVGPPDRQEIIKYYQEELPQALGNALRNHAPSLQPTPPHAQHAQRSTQSLQM